jgi:hypothetical protein
MTTRKSDSSNAALTIQKYLTDKGRPLPYTQCLDLVAFSQGFKNATVMKAAEKAALKPQPAKKFTATIVFGEELCRDWANASDTKKKRLLKQATVLAFNTHAELSAYLRGVNESNGWAEYAVVDHELAAVAANTEMSVPKGWTETNVRVRVSVRCPLQWAGKDWLKLQTSLDLEFEESASPSEFRFLLDKFEQAQGLGPLKAVVSDAITQQAKFDVYWWAVVATPDGTEEQISEACDELCLLKAMLEAPVLDLVEMCEIKDWEIQNSVAN